MEQSSIRGTTGDEDSATLDAELPRARSAIAETTNVLRQMSRDVQVGGSVDGAKMRQAVGYYRKRGAQPGRGHSWCECAGEERRILQPR